VGVAGCLGGTATLALVDSVREGLVVSAGALGVLTESVGTGASESAASGVAVSATAGAAAHAFVVSSATAGSAPVRTKASTGAQSQGRVDTSSAE
jgi:hypothetical protein